VGKGKHRRSASGYIHAAQRFELLYYSATGAQVRVSYHIALLAKACEFAGQVEEALFLLDDALQIAERTGECWFSSELYRDKGQLMWRQGDSEAAEALYRQALAIAKKHRGQALGIARRRQPR
jgi:tetratricopeptide (TPR) repeat protein